MKAKLYKVLDQYHLYDGDKAIATTIVGNPMLLPNLSKQNCDEIFGIIDVELMADFYGASVKGSLDFKFGANKGFEEGFNKAMELNKDKLFTVEDMRTAMLNAIEMTDFQKEQFRKDNDYHIALDIIQSLQQPTEIEVEIETEENANIALKARSMQFSTQRATNAVKEAWFPNPKLDSEGCLILKKI
jgi:hypothetical protein